MTLTRTKQQFFLFLFTLGSVVAFDGSSMLCRQHCVAQEAPAPAADPTLPPATTSQPALVSPESSSKSPASTPAKSFEWKSYPGTDKNSAGSQPGSYGQPPPVIDPNRPWLSGSGDGQTPFGPPVAKDSTRIMPTSPDLGVPSVVDPNRSGSVLAPATGLDARQFEVAKQFDAEAQTQLQLGNYVAAAEQFLLAREALRSVSNVEVADLVLANRTARTRLIAGDFVDAKRRMDSNLAIAQSDAFKNQMAANYALPFAHSQDVEGDTLELLAEYYRLSGDYLNAIENLKTVIDRRREIYGPTSRQYAIALHNLGVFYWSREDYTQAEKFIRDEMSILEASQADAASLTHCGETLALILTCNRNFDEATKRFEQAIDFYQSQSEYQVDLARVQNNLGYTLIFADRLDEAESLLNTALQSRLRLVGNEHLDYADSLNDLARLQLVRGDYAKSFELAKQSLAIVREHVVAASLVQSERQQLAMAELFRSRLDLLLTAASHLPQVQREAYEEVLNWKGSTTVRQRSLRELADDEQLRPLFERLQSVIVSVSWLRRNIPTTPEESDKWKVQLHAQQALRESIESQINGLNKSAARSFRRVTIDEVQATIPADFVLLDYFCYGEVHRSDKFGTFESTPRVMATVLSRDGQTKMFYLSDLAPIVAQINDWRRSYGESADADKTGRELSQTLLPSSILPAQQNTHLLISTDDALGWLPFAALPSGPNRYLIEDYPISYVPIPQLLPDLLDRKAASTLSHELLLVGDVDYNAGGNRPATAELANKQKRRPWERGAVPSSLRGDTQWGELAETRNEVEFIGGLYRRLFTPGDDAVLDLRQDRATEAAFKLHAPNSMFLHIATHGFFANVTSEAAQSVSSNREATTSTIGSAERSMIDGFNPGQMSGLVLAGANRPLDTFDAAGSLSDDGILTADEIACLPCNGVRLVVLSACETGLGEVAGGEGLLGIQRAFQVAGARTTVASLWKVNDAATRRLMQEFYTNYLEKEMSVSEALRAAQIWAINNPADVPRGDLRVSAKSDKSPQAEKLSPRYWAPFVLSGDWQ